MDARPKTVSEILQSGTDQYLTRPVLAETGAGKFYPGLLVRVS